MSTYSNLTKFVADWLNQYETKVIYWRRYLHSHPELSRKEFNTSEFIFTKLTVAGLNPVKVSNSTGIICDIGKGENRIAFRADMDALPINETTSVDFAAKVKGISHACGHDVHMTILLGLGVVLAEYLRAGNTLPIPIRLIFQPAEEVLPGGALDIINFSGLDNIIKIFAFHCDPKIKVGEVAIKSGPITSASDHIAIKLYSPGGHTARPHLTGDLIYAIGALITTLPGILSRRVSPYSGTVLTWGQVHAGTVVNSIPEFGVLQGTIRTASLELVDTLENLIKESLLGILSPLKIKYELEYHRGVPIVVNDLACCELLENSISNLTDVVAVPAIQSSGGEDFSWYLERIPGALARLGVWSGEGKPVDLHQSNFYADETAIALGIKVFAELIISSCSEAGS